MANNFHRPFLPVATIRHALAQMTIQMVQQHIALQQNSRMIPLISLNLHDYHIARFRRPVEFTESALVPAILIEVVRIFVFPPG